MRQAAARHHHCYLALLVLAAGAADAGAAIHTWTGPGSCTFSLQGCINSALPGDIIRVATNTPILENLTIDKSLTLRAAAGFAPVLDGIRVVSILNPSPRASTVVFEGFTITKGYIHVVQQSEGAFDVTLRSLTLRDVLGSQDGIGISTPNQTLYGPCRFSITDNEISIMPENFFTMKKGITISNVDAISMTGVICNNRIDDFGGGQGGAIELYGGLEDLQVDVIGNDIRGSGYNAGIVAIPSNGTSRFRFLDNLVAGEHGQAGFTGSIALRPMGISCFFEIVNNTVVNGDDGIRVDGGALADTVSGVVANNIVANMSRFGLSLEASSNAVERNNLIHNSPQFDFVPGPGTLLRDPLFVSPSSFRLSFASPARNAGDDASVPGDLVADLDGSARRVGRVDMGAYESTITVSSPPWVADRFRLYPNYPNPFNPSTTIQYELTRAERVRIGVFDVRGRLVRWLVAGATQNAGPHRSMWDGRNALGAPVPSGVYLCRLEAGPKVDSQRMVLAR